MRVIPARRYVLCGAAIVSAVAYYAAGAFPDPLAYGPFAPFILFLLIYPFAESGGWFAFALLFFPLYFASCSILSLGLLLRHKRAWEFSAALFVILAVANVAYFAIAWSDGVKWQGQGYTQLMLTLNVLVALGCAALIFKSRLTNEEPNWLLAAHILVLLWLSWISFPYLGEML